MNIKGNWRTGNSLYKVHIRALFFGFSKNKGTREEKGKQAPHRNHSCLQDGSITHTERSTQEIE